MFAQAVRDGLGAEFKFVPGKKKLKYGFVFAGNCRAPVVYTGKVSWHAVSLCVLLLPALADIWAVSWHWFLVALHAPGCFTLVSCVARSLLMR